MAADGIIELDDQRVDHPMIHEYPGLYAAQLQHDVFVSDKYGYISGELFVTDNGYFLAVMMSLRESTAEATISLMEGENAVQTYTVLADEPALLRISNVSQQTIRAVVRNRGKVLTDKTYRLDEIPGVSEGLRFSDYYADQTFPTG